jgi:hypothetical protein
MGNLNSCVYFDSAIISLIAGITLMTFPIIVCWKVHKGSNSFFAYTLMAFTFVDGLQYLANTIILAKDLNIEINECANLIATYCFYLVSLQTWVFAMKYWDSATICSINPTYFTPKTIRVIKWTGIGAYTSVMLVLCITLIVTLKLSGQFKG